MEFINRASLEFEQEGAVRVVPQREYALGTLKRYRVGNQFLRRERGQGAAYNFDIAAPATPASTEDAFRVERVQIRINRLNEGAIDFIRGGRAFANFLQAEMSRLQFSTGDYIQAEFRARSQGFQPYRVATAFYPAAQYANMLDELALLIERYDDRIMRNANGEFSIGINIIRSKTLRGAPRERVRGVGGVACPEFKMDPDSFLALYVKAKVVLARPTARQCAIEAFIIAQANQDRIEGQGSWLTNVSRIAPITMFNKYTAGTKWHNGPKEKELVEQVMTAARIVSVDGCISRECMEQFAEWAGIRITVFELTDFGSLKQTLSLNTVGNSTINVLVYENHMLPIVNLRKAFSGKDVRKANLVAPPRGMPILKDGDANNIEYYARMCPNCNIVHEDAIQHIEVCRRCHHGFESSKQLYLHSVRKRSEGYNTYAKCLPQCDDLCRVNESNELARYTDLDLTSNPIKCKACNCTFDLLGCALGHYTSLNRKKIGSHFVKLPTCIVFKRCTKCNCRLDTVKMYKESYAEWEYLHDCTDKYCEGCKKVHPRARKCWFPALKYKEDPIKFYFDFECRVMPEGKTHVPNVVCLQDAAGEETITMCDWESPKPLTDRFCELIFNDTKYKYATLIAHNGRAYDFHFILGWAFNNGIKIDVCIRNGLKIQALVIAGRRFVDSFAFLSTGLAAFPKTFAIKELRKGFFPYDFNQPENYEYEGAMPAKELYGDLGKRKAEFDTWYEEQQGFDFKKDIVEYCLSDVVLLRQGCEIFSKEFKELTGTDPFAYFTIASACFHVYHVKYVPKDTVYILDADEMHFIRRGLFGGRTEVFRPYTDKECGYSDVTSMYPWVNANFPYPKGESSGIIEWDETFDELNQLEVMEILRDLYGFYEVDVRYIRGTPDVDVAPLPEKENERLVFSFKAKTKQVYHSKELLMALENGWIVTKIHRFVHWKETTTVLFKEYVQAFMKLKIESSGWDGVALYDGTAVETVGQQLEWRKEVLERTGIDIDISKVKRNDAKRAIAKLMLNSLWGKFGQQSARPQTAFVTSTKEVLDLLRNYIIKDTFDVSDTMTEVVYSENVSRNPDAYQGDDGEMEIKNWSTNYAIAATTTVGARIKLFSALKAFGRDRINYCDTDSIIHIGRDLPPEVVRGGDLGQWTDETGGVPIVEFVALAPKVYAYKTADGNVELTAKGFSMKGTLTFEDYMNVHKGFVEGKPVSIEVPEGLTFRIDRRGESIKTLERGTKVLNANLVLKSRFNSVTGAMEPFQDEGMVDEL